MKRRRTFLVTLALIPVVGLILFRLWIVIAIDRAQDRVRAEGYPATADELIEFGPELPQGENGAEYLKLASESMAAPGPMIEPHLPIAAGANLPPRTEPIPKPMAATIQKFVLDNQTAYSNIEHAIDLGSYRFAIDNFEVINRRLADMRALARRTRVAALHGAIEQDSDAAAKGVLLTLGLADALTNDPVFISQLVRMAMCGHAIAALDETMSRVTYAAGDLETLQDRFEQVEAAHAMRNGIIGARADLSQNTGQPLQRVANGVTGLDAGKVLRGVTELAGIDQLRDLALYESYGRVLDALASPNAFDDAARLLDAADDMPAHLDEAIDHATRNHAQLRTAILAIAVERYCRDHDAYPGSADAVVPTYIEAIPTDPYGGESIRYRRLENGFVVYSIAQNLVDDQGVEMDKVGDAWREGDLTFIVERTE